MSTPRSAQKRKERPTKTGYHRGDPELHAIQRDNLTKAREKAGSGDYFTNPEKRREAQRKGAQRRDEHYRMFGKLTSFPSIPKTTWQELYLNHAITDPAWREYYVRRLSDLRELYAPQRGAMPQYEIMVDRLAMWDTYVHQIDTWFEAARIACARLPEGTDSLIYDAAATLVESRRVERADADQRILWYVQQLQKYTEAEKRVDLVVGQHEFAVLKNVSAIIEHVLPAEWSERVFGALQTALEGGGLADGTEARMAMVALPSPHTNTSTQPTRNGTVIEGTTVNEKGN